MRELNEQELNILYFLSQAMEAYKQLPELGKSDAWEFQLLIHQVQRAIMARPVLEEIFNIKPIPQTTQIEMP